MNKQRCRIRGKEDVSGRGLDWQGSEARRYCGPEERAVCGALITRTRDDAVLPFVSSFLRSAQPRAAVVQHRPPYSSRFSSLQPLLPRPTTGLCPKTIASLDHRCPAPPPHHTKPRRAHIPSPQPNPPPLPQSSKMTFSRAVLLTSTRAQTPAPKSSTAPPQPRQSCPPA